MFALKKAAVSVVIAIAVAGPPANANEISLNDRDGKPFLIDTEALGGCVIAFDDKGTPFEICRMEEVDLAPDVTSRRRPGASGGESEAEAESEVIYRRVEE